jgi:glycosyltransferase involved in cell wall biosynthesis
MRVLLVSHSYSDPGFRDKLDALTGASARLRDNPDLRAEFGARSIDRARHHYSQEVVMNQIVDLYQYLVGSHAAA